MKNRVFSSISSSIEWFDFALYGFFGPVFAQIFFSPAKNAHFISLIMTYSIFAIGFLSRPLGALIFGYIGDKYGRVLALKITSFLIALPTTAIAFIPSYNILGNVSIILLILMRILQGIFLGGEFSGNIVYLYESSKKWKYFWGSIGSCSGSFGILLASGLSAIFYAIFTKDFVINYGWRIAFFLALPLGLISFILRKNMPESCDFIRNKVSKNPITKSIKFYKKDFLYCLGFISLHATSFYFVFIFLPIFLTQHRNFNNGALLITSSGFLLLHLLFIPIFGVIVNQYDGFRSMIKISLLFIMLSIPLFYFISYGDKIFIIAAIFLLSIMTAMNAAIIPGLLSEITPPDVRYTIVASALNIGFGVFGGTMPLLGLLLIKQTNNILSPSIYLTTVALITLITTVLYTKKRKQ